MIGKIFTFLAFILLATCCGVFDDTMKTLSAKSACYTFFEEDVDMVRGFHQAYVSYEATLNRCANESASDFLIVDYTGYSVNKTMNLICQLDKIFECVFYIPNESFCPNAYNTTMKGLRCQTFIVAKHSDNCAVGKQLNMMVDMRGCRYLKRDVCWDD